MKNYEEIAYLRTESTFHIDKAYDKGYDRGYNDCKVELLEDEAKCHYQEGYNDGYRKGVERGKEARVAEADCAYQCGLRKAWDVARKIVLSDEDGGIPNDNILKIYSTCYYSVMKNIPVQEVIEKIEAWEKQEQTEKNCNTCKNDGWSIECACCGGVDTNYSKWTPKLDAPETNVGSIENRDKIVKALAGLLAAYGEQLWDVVADMQKNP